ncbi:hypothetical protein BDB01DRAFT_902881 [Pilobolus umbonatus]|nr:hypothetical protein BDB01DRAFT_902881 [Pilobolus umbonatus]
MEADIHCNVIKCRKLLSMELQACVTSCSQCANNAFDHCLVCPACNTDLPESDDIILTQLRPSEEYKSSVLAGLKPETIMDICSRGIAFYEYQISQEVCFQSMIKNNIEEKMKMMKEQTTMLTRDLNYAIKMEKEKNAVLSRDYDMEKKRCQKMYTELEDKSKQFQKLQMMYDKLKRKLVTSNMQPVIDNEITSNNLNSNKPSRSSNTSYISGMNRPSYSNSIQYTSNQPQYTSNQPQYTSNQPQYISNPQYTSNHAPNNTPYSSTPYQPRNIPVSRLGRSNTPFRPKYDDHRHASPTHTILSSTSHMTRQSIRPPMDPFRPPPKAEK